MSDIQDIIDGLKGLSEEKVLKEAHNPEIEKTIQELTELMRNYDQQLGYIMVRLEEQAPKGHPGHWDVFNMQESFNEYVGQMNTAIKSLRMENRDEEPEEE